MPFNSDCKFVNEHGKEYAPMTAMAQGVIRGCTITATPDQMCAILDYDDECEQIELAWREDAAMSALRGL